MRVIFAPISGVKAVQQDTEYLWQMALKNAIAEADPRLVRARSRHPKWLSQAFLGAADIIEEQALSDALDAIRRLKARDAQSRLISALEKGTARK